MRLLVLSLFIPLAMVVLSYGQVSVHIGGNDGLALLKNLTKSSPNLTGNDNTTNIYAQHNGNTASNARGNLSIRRRFAESSKNYRQRWKSIIEEFVQ